MQSEKCSVKSAKWECKADATTRCRSFILHFALNTSHFALSLAVALESPVGRRQSLAGVFDEAVPMVERRWNAGEVGPAKQHGHVEDSMTVAPRFA